MTNLIDTSNLIPSVEPTQTPGPMQHIETSPETFGAGLGQALEKTGSDAAAAASFYGNVASDHASDQWLDARNAILHGDPNKQGDTGFMGLQGAAAMSAYQDTVKRYDTTLAQIRSTLNSPQQLLQFDQYTRRMRAYDLSDMGGWLDKQTKTWAATTNTATTDKNLNAIAGEPNNQAFVDQATERVIAARTKAAILQGARPGDDVYENAVEGGHRDAVKTQILSIGESDPVRAAAMVTKNASILGTEGPVLAEHFKAKNDANTGAAAASQAWAEASAGGAGPAATGALFKPSDLPSYKARVAQIESGGGQNEGALGSYYQFTPATWASFGKGGARGTAQGEDAPMNRLTEANYNALSYGLGRAPTQAELYLAHQQGSQGALRLLGDPSRRAGDIVGDAAIRGNGGDPNAPAIQFTKMWQAKFDRTPFAVPAGGDGATAFTDTSGGARVQSAAFSPGEVPPPAPGPQNPPPQAQPAAPSPEAIAAEATRRLDARTDLTETQKQAGFETIKRELLRAQFAAQDTEKQQKEASDEAANGYIGKLVSGNTSGVLQAIAGDTRLKPEQRENLIAFAGRNGVTDLSQYGPGFSDIYRRVAAPAGDPSRISDPGDVLRMAALDDGGGGRAPLTYAGAQELLKVMKENTQSTDDAAVNTTKSSLMDYAKSKLSFDQTMLFPGATPLRDPVGAQAYSAQFVPKFLAAYDRWTKDGKDPWQFLTQENVDKLTAGLRDKRQMEMDRISATDQATGGESAAANQLPLHAPEGVQPQAWNTIVSAPPMVPDGQRLSVHAWSAAVARLSQNPTPEMIAAFDEKMSDTPYKARDVLARLAGAPQPQAPAGTPQSKVQTPERAPAPAPNPFQHRPVLVPVPAGGTP